MHDIAYYPRFDEPKLIFCPLIQLSGKYSIEIDKDCKIILCSNNFRMIIPFMVQCVNFEWAI